MNTRTAATRRRAAPRRCRTASPRSAPMIFAALQHRFTAAVGASRPVPRRPEGMTSTAGRRPPRGQFEGAPCMNRIGARLVTLGSRDARCEEGPHMARRRQADPRAGPPARSTAQSDGSSRSPQRRSRQFADCRADDWYGRERRKLPVSATRSPVCAAPGLQPPQEYAAESPAGTSGEAGAD